MYQVRGITQRRSGVLGRGGRALSRFVGRERELAMLHERLRHATQGQGQVLGIAGEPGIGKSRLLYEFCQSLRERPVTYCEGHCLAYGRATPYLPVRDLLRQLCGIAEADGPEAITTKVHACLQRWGWRPRMRRRISCRSWAWRPMETPWPAQSARDQGADVCQPCSRSAWAAVGGKRSSWRWRTCTGSTPPRRSG